MGQTVGRGTSIKKVLHVEGSYLCRPTVNLNVGTTCRFPPIKSPVSPRGVRERALVQV